MSSPSSRTAQLPAFPLSSPEERARVRVSIEGIVQGVGFRPFVHRLARRLGLGGWVANTAEGVLVEVEGASPLLDSFLQCLRAEAPVQARIDRLAAHRVPGLGEEAFSIRASLPGERARLMVPPDLATCADCARELTDPGDRRFRYPFITCTQCGPRFSLVTDVPYDRAGTTMAGFRLCPACRAEYGNETDRRFHAEPIACPACGPRLALWNEQGAVVALGEDALRQACALVQSGGVLAVKGLGGFQLWADAGLESAVERLRVRKRRPHKPFAVLFPSLDAVREACAVSPEEARVLLAPEAPIVLLRRLPGAALAQAVAPGNPYVGALLPSTPLHHVLAGELRRPVVATSGNRSEEPIVTDEREALVRLAGIADAWLVHDRPIARPVDDSVVRVAAGEVQILRRARGFVPLPIRLSDGVLQGSPLAPILALGGQLKNTVALACDDRVVLSQHLGDLSTIEADAAFRRAVDDLQRLLGVRAQVLACDLHPDYRSSLYARELAQSLSLPLVPVQHHHAHVAACMAEHGLDGCVLGVAWDGSGYGPDGTIWGGEFLVAGYDDFRRMAHLLPFRLPGGEQAVREPRRAALSLLWETFGDAASRLDLPPLRSLGASLDALAGMLVRGVSAPVTTSLGRLFDAVASLTDCCQVASFEGQAAMALQYAAEQGASTESSLGETDEEAYPIPLRRHETSGVEPARWVADWRPLVRAVVEDVTRRTGPACIGYRFHVALADLIGRLAEAAAVPRVVLTGGCFQNGLLERLARRRLERAGFIVYTHRLVPPNDGGLALGQAVVAGRRYAQARV